MSDFEPTPDDLLVSAVLDGNASPDEVQRVAADPRLSARLAEFRAVAEAVGGPVPLVDTAVRESHLAKALAAFGAGVTVATAPPSPHPPPPPPPAPPPPPVDLAAARARRGRSRSTTIFSIAAAVVLVVAAGAFLVRIADSTGTGGDDTAAGSDEARESTAADDAGGGDNASSEASNPQADEGQEAPASPTSTIAGDSGGAGSGIDTSLPSLGAFTKAEDLATRVQGELVLEPNPADLSAAQDFESVDVCIDDFGVEVALLGRATLEGEEGLVYVESAPRAARRLWLVDPGAVDADGACRQITPVQTL